MTQLYNSKPDLSLLGIIYIKMGKLEDRKEL